MTVDPLKAAIEEIKGSEKVNIEGRNYTQVSTRIEVFRRHFGTEYGIDTEMLPQIDPNIVRVKAIITDANSRVIASGLAEENRRDGEINMTSALENAETSAIGRALSAFGLAGGDSYASANEVIGAKQQQSAPRNPVRREVPDVKEQDERERSVPESEFKLRYYVPRITASLDLGNECGKVADQIARIRSLDGLSDYWHGLAEFRSIVREEDPEMYAELEAAFSVAGKAMKGMR